MTSGKTRVLLAILVTIVISISFSSPLFPKHQNSISEASPINVSCVGDSITQWSGYTNYLQDMLGKDYNVGNFGVAQTAVSNQWFRPYVKELAFQESKNFEPSIVIIMLGTNDAHTYQKGENFAKDYEEIIAEYLALSNKPRILIVKPPPIYDNNLELSEANLQEIVIPAIDTVAKDMNLRTIDVNSALAGHPEFFQDGVHPNSDGAAAIATQVNNAIICDDTSSEQVLEFD